MVDFLCSLYSLPLNPPLKQVNGLPPWVFLFERGKNKKEGLTPLSDTPAVIIKNRGENIREGAQPPSLLNSPLQPDYTGVRRRHRLERGQG